MKRKKFGMPVGMLALVVIDALGLTGVAYTYWTQNLVIGSTVTTGTLNASLSAAKVGEGNNVVEPVTATSLPTGISPSAGICTANQGADPQHVTISVTNMFPGYFCTIELTLDNLGSIPIDVDTISPSSLASLLSPDVQAVTTDHSLDL